MLKFSLSFIKKWIGCDYKIFRIYLKSTHFVFLIFAQNFVKELWQTCWMFIWISHRFFFYFLPRMSFRLMWSSTQLMDHFEDSRFNSTTKMEIMTKQMTVRSMFSWASHLVNRLLERVDLRSYIFHFWIFSNNKQ